HLKTPVYPAAGLARSNAEVRSVTWTRIIERLHGHRAERGRFRDIRNDPRIFPRGGKRGDAVNRDSAARTKVRPENFKVTAAIQSVRRQTTDLGRAVNSSR